MDHLWIVQSIHNLNLAWMRRVLVLVLSHLGMAIICFSARLGGPLPPGTNLYSLQTSIFIELVLINSICAPTFLLWVACIPFIGTMLNILALGLILYGLVSGVPVVILASFLIDLKRHQEMAVRMAKRFPYLQ